MKKKFIEIHRYDEAADAIRREITIHQENEMIQSIGRLTVALVLVQLARGDSVAAEKAFKEWGNCCDMQEVQTLEMLLQVRFKKKQNKIQIFSKLFNCFD